MWLGSTTAGGRGNCQTCETVTLGKLAWGTITGAARFSASHAWGNANKTLTATLGPRTNGTENPTLGHGDWIFNPASDAQTFLTDDTPKRWLVVRGIVCRLSPSSQKVILNATNYPDCRRPRRCPKIAL